MCQRECDISELTEAEGRGRAPASNRRVRGFGTLAYSTLAAAAALVATLLFTTDLIGW